jgi:hypothetical protein
LANVQRKDQELEEREQRLVLVQKQLERMQEDLRRRTGQGQKMQELLITNHKELQELEDRVHGEQKQLKMREKRLMTKRREFDDLVNSKAREQACKQDAHLRAREAKLKERKARFLRMQQKEKCYGQ